MNNDIMSQHSNRSSEMLNVLIKETNEVKSLSIIDPKTKIDYIGDFVGNTGAFGREFEKIEHDEAEYQASEGDFEWWENVVKTTQEADDLMFENPDKITDEVKEKLYNINENDIDTYNQIRLSIIKQAIA